MEVNGISIEVERKNIKHAHLAVYPPDGRVHISVPTNYSEDRIYMYLLQKWSWIEEKRERLSSYTRQPELRYVSGEPHYLKGVEYRLKVNRMSSGPYEVFTDGDYIVINVHRTTTKGNIQQVLCAWYKEQLSPLIQRFVAKWEKILNVRIYKWEIRLMAARWGSCSKANGRAWFNVELAKKPIDCIEYIVAHELTHLLERKHNDRFLRIMDTHLPSWQELRKKLNKFPL